MGQGGIFARFLRARTRPQRDWWVCYRTTHIYNILENIPQEIAEFVKSTKYLLPENTHSVLCTDRPCTCTCILSVFPCVVNVNGAPVSMALDSFTFHCSATSLARGSSGLGALNRAWIESSTVLIWRAGLHLSSVNGVFRKREREKEKERVREGAGKGAGEG